MERNESDESFDGTSRTNSVRTNVTVKVEENTEENTLNYYLWIIAKDCKLQKKAYWKQYYKYKKYNNLISIPTLIISSGTGMSSIAQFGSNTTYRNTLTWITTICSITSTVLTTIQRYFRFAERATLSKSIAKSYNRLAQKIQSTLQIYESDSVIHEDLYTFYTTVQNELDVIISEIDDIPLEIVNRDTIEIPHEKLKNIKANVIMSRQV